MFWIRLLIGLFLVSCGQEDSSSSLEVQKQLRQNPLYEVRFEKNMGQTDPQVAFVGRGAGYNLFLTKDRMVFDVTLKVGGQEEDSYITASGTQISETNSYVFNLKLVGANQNPTIEGAGEHDGIANYYVGPKSKWVSNVPRFEQVKYKNVYQGIDLVFYGTGGDIEHDFIVSPSVDPSVIRVSLDGVKNLSLTDYGDLKIGLTETESFKFKKPIAYQMINGRKIDVAAHYDISGTTFGFKLGYYNPDYELVIDPTANLPASTLVGPTTSNNNITMGIATDGTSYYAVGYTRGGSFPTPITANGTPSAGGDVDAFIFQINSSLNQSPTPTVTYFGGSGDDFATSISIFGTTVFVGGYTTSSGISVGSAPTAPLYSSYQGAYDGFVATFSTTLSTPASLYYFGGTGFDSVMNIVATSSTACTIVGTTNSSSITSFSTTYGSGTAGDAFVARLSSLTVMANGAYVGGANRDIGVGLALDSSANVYISGETRSSDFPQTTTAAPFQTCPAGSTRSTQDAFFAKFDSALTRTWAGCFGGSATDGSSGIALDTITTGCTTPGPPCIDVLGTTNSTGLPVTTNAFQSANAGGFDLYVGQLSGATPPASNFLTYFGGTSDEATRGTRSIAVDGNAGIWVTGRTASATATNFISTTTNAIATPALDTKPANSSTAGLVARFAPNGALSFSTYLGGSTTGAFDEATGVVTSAAGNLNTAYVVGNAASTNFPTAVASGTVYSATHSSSTTSEGFISQIQTTDIKLIGTPTTGASASTTLTLNIPTAAKPGDYLIAVVATAGGNPATIPTAATIFGTALTSASITNNVRAGIAVFSKIATASDISTGSANFTVLANKNTGIMMAFRGVNSVAPTDGVTPTIGTATNNTGSIVAPTITPTTTRDMLVTFYMVSSGVSGTSNWTANNPATQSTVTMTKATEIVASTTPGMSLMAATSTTTTNMLAASATGTITGTSAITAVRGRAITVVLKQQ